MPNQMKRKVNLPHFADINDYMLAIGLKRRARYPFLDVFRLDDFTGQATPAFPPFRKNFYEVLLLTAGQATLQIDAHTMENLGASLVFLSPDHVYAWRQAIGLRGFVVYFKQTLFTNPLSLLAEFPFFRQTESNVIALSQPQMLSVGRGMENIFLTYESDNPYKVPIMESLLLALLYYCKSLFEERLQHRVIESRSLAIVSQYRELVAKCYLQRKTVEAYADMMQLTANHLNEVIKQSTGKTARSFIVDHLLLEAKNLLLHTSLDVAEIAFRLHFEEPTHFGKFFKRYTGASPGQFRRLAGQ